MSRNWYILSVYTGYEKKVDRNLKALIEKGDVSSDVITDIKLPLEEIVEIKDGKKKVTYNNFMPSYLLLEMDLPEIGWKDYLAPVYKIQGVTGFVGCISRKDRPIPIKTDEAKSLLMKIGAIKGEKQVQVRQLFNVGDHIKITEGAFASFTGVIKEINSEKEKLSVEVQIFGRPTPVELNYMQAEKI